ncbi:enoyl-CoA hydratase/isomerase family protein [Holophaga foetida]|uniref:enoyl-CoA hydratase/isomerase family protein n=1 Tax=Holophaga foetida TaxID=35839 RepID=UPI00024717A9|nr:enoyl-CoA hydratase/isomerase family protein [Holophaga foetida]
MDPHEGQILSGLRGSLGFITLNRPRSLNALSLGMLREITRLLHLWREDDQVRGVVVRGACPAGRGPVFCAGGDIRALYHWAVAGDPRVEDFFNEEFSLVHFIHTYPKPYLALMDGITMGGGMGISQGARLRIVTEHSRLAMPETNIGLFPDVAGGYFLSRLPGAMGEFLGLTGQILGPGEAMALGLADLFVPSARLPELEEALVASPEAPLEVARGFAGEAPGAPLLEHREAFDRHFGAPSLAAILASLARDPSPLARRTLEILQVRSPLMLAVTLRQLRRGRSLGLADNLRMERDLMRHCFRPRPHGLGSEAVEGIRALVVDKDRQPGWHPATAAELSSDMVSAFFESPWTEYGHPLRHLGR